MEEKSAYRRFLLILLMLIGMRLINLGMPILEGTAARQVQTAMIARNFYLEGFNILYPKVDFFGSEPGYLILDFPLLNFLSAGGYKLLGGVHEWVGRILSILFFAGAASFLFRIVKRIFGSDTALWSVLIFGLSPLSLIFSRAFMPDFEMLFFSLGALYYFLEFHYGGRPARYWLSALFFSIAMLIKPHSFYMALPVGYLMFKGSRERRALGHRDLLYSLIAVIPAALWYMRASRLHSVFTQEQAFNFQLLNWFSLKEMFSLKLYLRLIEIYSGIFLTPLGLALFIFGLFIKTKDEENIVWFWLVGGVLFMAAFVTHITDPYYNIILLPLASVFAARAVVFLISAARGRTFLEARWVRVVLILLIFPLWIRYAAYAYVVPAGYRYIPEAGRKMQQIALKEDLVIASAAAGPQALYFCNRKGWGFSLPGRDELKNKNAIERLEGLRKKGAVFFMSTVMEDFNKSAVFKEYMFKNYPVVYREEGRFIIFRLR